MTRAEAIDRMIADGLESADGVTFQGRPAFWAWEVDDYIFNASREPIAGNSP